MKITFTMIPLGRAKLVLDRSYEVILENIETGITSFELMYYDFDGKWCYYYDNGLDYLDNEVYRITYVKDKVEVINERSPGIYQCQHCGDWFPTEFDTGGLVCADCCGKN